MDYQEFLGKADVWDVFEAVDILLDMKPIRRDDPDPNRAHDLRELAYRAIDAGNLPCIGKKKERRVAPRDFVLWAISKGYQAPDSFLIGDGGNKEETGEPHPIPAPNDADEMAVAITLDTVNAKPNKEKRRVAWRRELLIAWPQIVPCHGARPGALKVMAWLKRNGPSDVFPKDQPDSFSLQWTDEFGNTHTVTKKTVETYISECRKMGEMPG